jgi:hypothetical protein
MVNTGTAHTAQCTNGTHAKQKDAQHDKGWCYRSAQQDAGFFADMYTQIGLRKRPLQARHGTLNTIV